ncbi:hypothetical protein [Paraburkholderia caribensis]|uniref:hypothetical protein n=1 Tax=Paraburkholderia caribensis TaxID=75105 RepID=UPI00285F37DF|nr:hypothetical protein [Paraburkholderia caribensis]MDR6381827.1 hypothetical protein [Paraburkholderia caribensis]
MSFIYPRTISITRQPAQSGGGLKPYGGVDPGEEVTLYTGLPASIQQKSTGARPDPRLPADAANRTFWRIFMPLSAGVTPGSVLRGDIATDDAGQRYFIEAPYINSLGANFLVERLEA